MILRINGDIVSNELERVYKHFGFECTTPGMVNRAFAELPKGDRMQVKINSGGGDVLAGQEIYTTLLNRTDVDIEVESLAGSAASVIAMAAPSSISPVGMVMIHNVSIYGVGGNKNDLIKTADTLGEFDKALAQAYVTKTGRPVEEILGLMDKETWLTAQRAVELGFIDRISTGTAEITNMYAGLKVTPEMVAQYQAEMAAREKEKTDILADLDIFGGKEKV